MSRMDRSARSVSQPRGKRDSSVSSAYGGAGGTNKTKNKKNLLEKFWIETEPEKRRLVITEFNKRNLKAIIWSKTFL